MARRDKLEQRRKLVMQVVIASGADGITTNDLQTRLSGKVGRHDLRETIASLKIDCRVRAEGARVFATEGRYP